MNVLVSGSSGFVGSSLSKQLIEAGHRVVKIVRHPPGDNEVGIDLNERVLDRSKVHDFDEIDAVFHLAGEPLSLTRWGPQKRERIRASRTVMTNALTHALASLDRPPTVLISMSATGYYGSRNDERLDEQSPPGSGFLVDVCRAWEAATAPAQEAGIRVVTTRMAPVIGHGGGLVEKVVPIFRLGLGAKLGSGRQWMSFIALDDVVKALLHLATSPGIEGPVNLVSPEPVRNEEFTAALSAKLGRPAPFRVPRALLVGAFGGIVADEFILTSQHVVPAVLSESGYEFVAPSIAEALDRALDHP